MAIAQPLGAAGGYPGSDALVYRLDPPLAELDEHGARVYEHSHVVVYTTPAAAHTPAETKLIGTTDTGAPVHRTMRSLVRYSHPYGPNHAGALWLAGGYSITEPEPDSDSVGEVV